MSFCLDCSKFFGIIFGNFGRTIKIRFLRLICERKRKRILRHIGGTFFLTKEKLRAASAAFDFGLRRCKN
jgi:hypothetical protein